MHLTRQQFVDKIDRFSQELLAEFGMHKITHQSLLVLMERYEAHVQRLKDEGCLPEDFPTHSGLASVTHGIVFNLNGLLMLE